MCDSHFLWLVLSSSLSWEANFTVISYRVSRVLTHVLHLHEQNSIYFVMTRLRNCVPVTHPLSRPRCFSVTITQLHGHIFTPRRNSKVNELNSMLMKSIPWNILYATGNLLCSENHMSCEHMTRLIIEHDPETTFLELTKSLFMATKWFVTNRYHWSFIKRSQDKL